jgi:hypothetical protein
MLSSSGILSLKRKSLLKRNLRRMRKMTREDIIRMAREAGMKLTPAQFSGVLEDEIDEFQLEKFAALVAAASEAKEREACAKVCDDKHDTWRWDDETDSASGPRDCAVSIRARGQA